METSGKEGLNVGDFGVQSETVDYVEVMGAKLVSCGEGHKAVIGRDVYLNVLLLIAWCAGDCLVSARRKTNIVTDVVVFIKFVQAQRFCCTSHNKTLFCSSNTVHFILFLQL